MRTAKSRGRMKIYNDLMNQSKLISVQGPPQVKDLRLTGRGAEQTIRSPEVSNQVLQASALPSKPQQIHINTNLKIRQPGGSDSKDLKIRGILGNHRPGANEQIRIQDPDLLIASAVETPTSRGSRFARRHRSVNPALRGGGGPGEDKLEQTNTQSSGPQKRMHRNMEQLTNIKLVGGSTRLNQLIELMQKKGQKQQRMQNIELSRLDNESQQQQSELQTEHESRLSEGNAEGMRLRANQQLNLGNLHDQFESIKQKNNIHVVINVGNEGAPGESNPIDTGPGQAETVAGRAAVKSSERKGAEFGRLGNVGSVQRLGRDQDIHFMDGYDDVSLYQTGDTVQPPSMMILTKGDKQMLEGYAKQYNSKLSGKQAKSPAGGTVLQQLPHTTKHAKLKIALATRTAGPGDADGDSTGKLNTDHSTINSNNILLQQGIGYSSLDKSLVKLPLIGTGQTTSPLHSNLGQVFGVRSGSKRTPHTLTADSDNGSKERDGPDHPNFKNHVFSGNGTVLGPKVSGRNQIMQGQSTENSLTGTAKKRDRSYRKATSYQNYELPRKGRVLDSMRTLDVGERAPKGVAEIVNKLQQEQSQLYGDQSDSQRLNFDRYSQFKVKKMRFGKESGSKVSMTRGVPAQVHAQQQATAQIPQKLLNSAEKTLNNIKSIKSVLVKDGAVTSENLNQASTRMLTVDPSQHQHGLNSPSTASLRQQVITPFHSKGSLPSPAAVSYNVLTNDKERTNQLLEVFNRRLRSLGYQKEKYTDIIKHGSARRSTRQSPLGSAGIEGEVQSLRAMLVAQELNSRPGGHIHVRKASSSRSPGTSPARTGGHSLSASTHEIAEAHQKAARQAHKHREEARIKITNMAKHRNATKMIGQVEKKVKEAKGAFAADLSIDDQKIQIGPSPVKDRSRRSRPADEQKNAKSRKFADNYNFDQYDDKDIDSDLAEQEALSAIDIEEYQKAQHRLAAQEAKKLSLPSIDGKRKPSRNFSRHRTAERGKSPAKHEIIANADGSVQYSEELLRAMTERRDSVGQRLREKKEFRKDIGNIAEAGALRRDIASLNTDVPALGAQVVTQPMAAALSRQQTNKLYKDDFEYKISQMNQRLQPEFDDVSKKVALSSRVLGPFPSAQGLMDDLKKKEESRKEKVLQRYKKQRASTIADEHHDHDDVDVDADSESERPPGLGHDDSEDSAEHEEGEEQADDSPPLKDSELAEYLRKPPQLMSGFKKRQQRKYIQRQLKRQMREEKSQEALRSVVQKVQAARWLREPTVPEEESGVEDDSSSGPETYEEKKKRENIEEYHEIRRLPRSARKERIMQKNKNMVDQDAEAEAKAKKWHGFLNRINREEEYPSSLIQKLVVRNMQNLENQRDEEATTQELSRQFAENDIINGLCLLQCLKTNQIDQDVFNEELTAQASRNSKNIMKAASLVKDFQSGAKKEDEVDDPQLKLSRYLARGAPGAGGAHGAASYRSDATPQRAPRKASLASPRSMQSPVGSPGGEEGEAVSENQRRIFNTRIFNKVLKQIVGFKFVEPAFHRQIAQQLDKLDPEETGESQQDNMILEELKRRERALMSKMLETPDAKTLAQLKQQLRTVKSQITEQQEQLRTKATASMVEYAKMDKSELGLQGFARRVNLQSQFFEVCKYAENPKITEQLCTNPVMLYFKNCQKEGSVSLPIPVLRKVHNKILTLINYSLTNGVCSALGTAMKGNPQLLHSVLLDSNGCKDEDFTDLLKGLQHLDHVKSIIYKRNEILKTQTIENIFPILTRSKPRHLEELRIINCRIGGAVTHKLVDALVKHSSLKKLSLVNASLTYSSFNQLLVYIKDSRALQHLDLSCNSLRQEQMFSLVEVLSADRKLLSVDLSWNTMMDAQVSILRSTIADTKYRRATKKETKAAERTAGQFSDLSQKAVFLDKRQAERQKEIDLLGDETYSLITGTNVTSAAGGTVEGQRASTDYADPDEGGPGMGEEPGEEGAAGENDGVETGGDGAEGQSATEAPAEADRPSSPDLPRRPVKEVKKKSKLAPPTPKRRLTEAEKQVKRRRIYVEKMTKALRKNLVSFVKYNQALQHLNLSNTGLAEEVVRSIGVSLNKARGLVAIHLSGNPGITDRTKEFLRKRIKCKTIEPAFKLEFDVEKYEKKGTAPKATPQAILTRNSSLDALGKKQLVQDNLKLQLIKKTAQINDPSVKLEQGDSHRLDFVRVVGHQCDMPGSQQWALYDDHQDARQRCWACDQSIHSLIFWTQSIGDRHSVLGAPRDLAKKETITRQLVQRYDQLQPINVVDSADRVEQRLAKLYTFLKEDVDRPLICCEYTNWKPTRMLRVDEYCASLESSGARAGIDIYDQLISQGLISPIHKNSKKFEELDELEQEEFIKYRTRTMSQYQQNWYDTLADEIRYKKPYLANGEYLSEIGHPEEEQLYVFPCFMRAGRQNYIIVQEDDLACNTVESVDMPRDPDAFYIHKCIVETRPEDLTLWSKPLKNGEKARVFQHAASVFRDWKPDNKASVAKCLEHDFSFWKLPRFCKDPDEQARVMDKAREYFPQIKEVFHYLIAKSSYPTISFQDFSDWAKQVQIYDGTVIDEKRVTLAFEAANYVIEAQPGAVNPENALCRYEFLEILLRLAKDKYITFDKKTDKLSEAFEMIIQQCLIQHDRSDPWTGFREEELWTLSVNDLLEPNKVALQELWESYFEPRKKHMDLRDCQDLFYKQTGLLKQDKHVEYCFAMARMTVAQECREHWRYDQLSFAEFLELCARVAQYKFKDDPNISHLDLAQKLECVLDEVLATQDVKRQDPIIVHQDVSESDEDY